MNQAAKIFPLFLLGLFFHLLLAPPAFSQEAGGAGFEIVGYLIEGNTLMTDETLQELLDPFIGSEMTAATVEKARDALEQKYHEAGYPTVLVNIPEQTVEDGYVRLAVVESRIRRVRITGNRYFTMKKIREDLPSLAPGSVLYLPELQEELNRLNRSRDLKVAPVLMAGKSPGTTDVELKVKDRLPLHGSLDLSNRASHNTSSLRLNAMIRYENLWQKSHSASFQYQTAPEKPREVQVAAGSYILPSPLDRDDLLVFYSVLSDSETSFGEGFQVTGKGNIYGVRYVRSLPSYEDYSHNLTFGLDYKDFDEALRDYSSDTNLKTPITYLPLSFSYTGSLPDSSGLTQFSAGLNLAFRSLVTDMREFETKRFGARGNYLYATLGIERRQKLPAGFGIYVKADGQLASQPLVSNEQFTAGGMQSVRGYKESEESGDNGLHATVEAMLPGLGSLFQIESKYLSGTPFLFYDYAHLKSKSPLPGQDPSQTIQGAGFGMRGTIYEKLSYDLSFGVALTATTQTDSGAQRGHFVVKYEF